MISTRIALFVFLISRKRRLEFPEDLFLTSYRRKFPGNGCTRVQVLPEDDFVPLNRRKPPLQKHLLRVRIISISVRNFGKLKIPGTEERESKKRGVISQKRRNAIYFSDEGNLFPLINFNSRAFLNWSCRVPLRGIRFPSVIPGINFGSVFEIPITHKFAVAAELLRRIPTDGQDFPKATDDRLVSHFPAKSRLSDTFASSSVFGHRIIYVCIFFHWVNGATVKPTKNFLIFTVF